MFLHIYILICYLYKYVCVYMYINLPSRNKYLQHATSIMRNLLKCEKACDRACRYILCYRAVLYRAHFPAALTTMSAHRISNFDLACFRERASNRCAYVPWRTSQVHGVVCRRTVAFPRTLFFGNRLLAGRARDFLECFRCLVHVWALLSVRSDTKEELTAFSRSYVRVRILMKSRFNRSHPAVTLFSKKLLE